MKIRPFEGMIQINHNNAIREKSKKMYKILINYYKVKKYFNP